MFSSEGGFSRLLSDAMFCIIGWKKLHMLRYGSSIVILLWVGMSKLWVFAGSSVIQS